MNTEENMKRDIKQLIYELNKSDNKIKELNNELKDSGNKIKELNNEIITYKGEKKRINKKFFEDITNPKLRSKFKVAMNRNINKNGIIEFERRHNAGKKSSKCNPWFYYLKCYREYYPNKGQHEIIKLCQKQYYRDKKQGKLLTWGGDLYIKKVKDGIKIRKSSIIKPHIDKSNETEIRKRIRNILEKRLLEK